MARLPSQVLNPDIPMDGYYTIEQFICRVAVRQQKGCIYGYQSAYIKAAASSPHPASDHDFKVWKRAGLVPAVYYEQIDILCFCERPVVRHNPWHQDEVDFLRDLHQSNPGLSNGSLAHQCTEHFGRIISESAIKGKLDRLRKEHIVPQYRNTETAA